MKIAHVLLLALLLPNLYGIIPAPYLSLRSQGEQAQLELMGLTHLINRCGDDNYVTIAVTQMFDQSFLQNRIADCLFGNDLLSDTLSAINVTGSEVTTRNATKDWLADYFGLPTDYNGTIRFLPHTINVLTDFYCYIGLNHWCKGVFITLHAPVVYARAHLDYFEAIAKEGNNPYVPGYLSAQVQLDNVGVARTDMLNATEPFFSFGQTPKLGIGAVFQPLLYAKFAPHDYACKQHVTALADIHCVLGYNAILTCWSHLGAGLRAVIPTGNRPNGTYTFETIVGNGGHWQLGAQVWGHYRAWCSECADRDCTLSFLLNITHMFAAKQKRVFDLCGKPNSRYMLAEQMSSPVEHLRANSTPDDLNPANFLIPNAAFAGQFAPVANLTRRTVKVSAAFDIDAVGMISYTHHRLVFDFGYNLWARSCERITKLNCPTPLTTQQWALKGTASVYGFTFATGPEPVPNNTPVPLSATQSTATIHGGSASDNQKYAVATFSGGDVVVNNGTTDAPIATQAITSWQPVLIQEQDLAICAAQTRGLSHKLFVHLQNNWNNHSSNYVPFIGGGFELEYGNKNVPQQEINTGCMRCAISRWGFWIRGGFLYR